MQQKLCNVIVMVDQIEYSPNIRHPWLLLRVINVTVFSLSVAEQGERHVHLICSRMQYKRSDVVCFEQRFPFWRGIEDERTPND